jgi:hypothetical protein
MFSHWYSRLVSTAAALALGAGVLFISGCGDDCCSDSGGSQPVSTVNTGYETQSVSYSDGTASSTSTTVVDQTSTSSQDESQGPVKSTVKGATHVAGEAVEGAGNIVHGIFH